MTATAIWDLIEQGEYGQAAQHLSHAPRLNLEHQILRQLVAVETANAQLVREETLSLLARRPPNREKILCLFALSRASAVCGEDMATVDSARQAVELAVQSADRLLVSRAQARYTSSVLRSVGIEGALPELRKLRSMALAAADASALTEFHCLVGEIEIKQRRHNNALSHLSAAQALCERFPNLRLHTQVFRLKANVALFSSKPSEARKWAASAVEMAERSGGYLSLTACLSTMAHACLVSGSLDIAESTFNRILAIPLPGSARIAAVDGLIQVALERRDVAKASQLVSELIQPPPDSGSSYYWLWHIPSRARCWMAEGAPERSLTLLRKHSAAASSTRDEQLQHAFQLAEAEALASCGRMEQASEHLALVLGRDRLRTLEGALTLNRIAAKIFAPDETIARNLKRRASRIHDFALAANGTDSLDDDAYVSAFELLHAAASFFTTPVDARLTAHDASNLLNASGLATARELMSARFAEVTVSYCPGERAVTDGEALVDALTSYPPGDGVSEMQVDELRRLIAGHMTAGNGVVRIPKLTGMVRGIKR